MFSLQTTHDSDVHLKMVFHWQTDRWGHRVSIVIGQQETTILRSIEGDHQTDWPPSPPLQDASQHDLAGGAAVLAVGMAGTSHWSASFSVDNSERLNADLACLFKGQPAAGPQALMSTYQIQPDVEILADKTGNFELIFSGYRFEVRPLKGEDWNSKVCQESKWLTIAPDRFSDRKTKSTRWGYQLKRVI